MKLKDISISSQTWGDNKGTYTGYVTYINPVGEIRLNLNKELSSKVLTCLSTELNSLALTGVLGLQELLKDASQQTKV